MAYVFGGGSVSPRSYLFAAPPRASIHAAHGPSMRAALVTVAFVSAVTSVGCSAKDDAADKYPTADSFCDAKGRAECAKVAVDQCLVQLDACITQRKATCMAFAASAVGPRRSYKPARAQACIDATTAAYSDSALTVKEESPSTAGSMGETCARTFEGTSAKGADCAGDFDCQPGLVCGTSRVPGSVPTCATKTDRKKGDQCANAGDACEAGSYCNETASCVPKRALGEACGPTAPCDERLRCDAASRCIERATLGGICNTQDDCSPDAPYCVPLDGPSQCAKALTFAPGVPACRDYGRP